MIRERTNVVGKSRNLHGFLAAVAISWLAPVSAPGSDSWDPLILQADTNRLALGHFIGSKTSVVGRAYWADQLNADEYRVELRVTQTLTDDMFRTMPNRLGTFLSEQERFPYLGRSTGPQILEEIRSGRLDGGLIGEGSFLAGLASGQDLVAIAMLGQDSADAPGKVVMIRDDLSVWDASGLRGKSVAIRAAGPADRAIFDEFLVTEGLDDGSVHVIDGVDHADIRNGLIDGCYDGVFVHLHAAERLARPGHAYRFRDFDWMDPAVSIAVVAVTRRTLHTKRAALEHFLTRVVQRIRYEETFPEVQRRRFDGNKLLRLDLLYFDGLNVPQNHLEPRVPIDQLEQMDGLLLQHGVYDRSVRPADHVDNSLVNTILRRIDEGSVSSLPLGPRHILEPAHFDRREAK